jgi:hypothetical protein
VFVCLVLTEILNFKTRDSFLDDPVLQSLASDWIRLIAMSVWFTVVASRSISIIREVIGFDSR